MKRDETTGAAGLADLRQRPSVPTGGAAARPPRHPGPRWRSAEHVAERWALLVLFAVMMIIFIGTASGFSNGQNLRIVVGTQAPLVILAIAAMVPLAVGQFDLSVAAVAGTAGIALVTTVDRFHAPLGVGVAVALLISALIGLLSGVLVAFLNLNAFIVTLGVSTVLQGVVQGYTGGAVLPGSGINALETAMTGNVGGIPKGVFWFLPVALVAWYLIEQTPSGRHLRSIGSNAGAARLLGVPTRGLTMSTFAMSGLLGGLAGIAVVAQSGTADPSVTQGAELLPAMAAAFLGASAFLPGLFNVAGTVLAVFFVAFLVNGLQYLGAQPWTSPVIDGAVLIGAITVSSLLRRERARG
jgi:ribose transport system permease protein